MYVLHMCVCLTCDPPWSREDRRVASVGTWRCFAAWQWRHWWGRRKTGALWMTYTKQSSHYHVNLTQEMYKDDTYMCSSWRYLSSSFCLLSERGRPFRKSGTTTTFFTLRIWIPLLVFAYIQIFNSIQFKFNSKHTINNMRRESYTYIHWDY